MMARAISKRKIILRLAPFFLTIFKKGAPHIFTTTTDCSGNVSAYPFNVLHEMRE
jgi:hypothetical protein